MKALDETVAFEVVPLAKANLEPCRGCFLCIAHGEGHCPLKDGRAALEEKIRSADAVVFATPVYTYNVSGIMKNFLDRFAYRCHRPDFAGKKAMVAVTTGAVGLGFVSWLLRMMVGAMGFVPCAAAVLTCPPAHERDDKRQAREAAKAARQAEKFYRAVLDPRPAKPSLLKLMVFLKQRKAFMKAPEDSADFRFWSEKGWLGAARYYYEAPVGVVKQALASLMARARV
jgi:multimeric flavodoxin WrbA